MPATDEALILIVRSRRFRRGLRAIFLLLLCIVVIRSSVIDIEFVPSISMVPTLLVGDHVLVNKLSFGIHVPLTHWQLIGWSEPKVGDIVIFDSPAGGLQLVKRVVGISGDRVNGTLVPADSVYVMGDNRDHSLDSRVFGPVPRRMIVGRAARVVWSGDPDQWIGWRKGRFNLSLN